MQYHYDECHSVRDPEVVTSIAHRCPDCKQFFGKQTRYHMPSCPVRLENRRALEANAGQWMEAVMGPHPAPPQAWWVATDGSGKEDAAGWGAVIFRYEGPGTPGRIPDYVLHAPVATQAWDHRWLGARVRTNNTAELSAIGEVCHWLLEEAPDNGTVPVHLRFDSFYAANMARGIWEPSSNEELAAAVRELVVRLEERRTITWEHVYGHTGEHDNELADRAADLGRDGYISDVSRRLTAPPPAVRNLEWHETDFCKKCGAQVLVKDIVWHFRRCQAVGRVIPEGKSKCRKCGMLVKETCRTTHENKCRGSDLANRTCRKCGRVFPAPPDGKLSIALGTHEKFCKGAPAGPGGAAVVAAAPAGAAAPKAAPKGKAKAKAVPKAKAKSKAQARPRAPQGRGRGIGLAARAKGKAHSKAKAKGKAKGKARALARV